MTLSVEIIADSVNIETLDRITTFVLRYPRIVHADFMTHRMLSRNASSSRARPVKHLLQEIEGGDIALPVVWTKNRKGMQGGDVIERREFIDTFVEDSAWEVKRFVENLLESENVHKQHANRYLEPYTHITVVATATDWDNFFWLRCSDLADPTLAALADMMLREYLTAIPRNVAPGDWHLPFIRDEERAELLAHDGITALLKVATGRCARVSYLTHDGVRDFHKDIELHDQLVRDGHWSPFEHCAKAMGEKTPWKFSGNFIGWMQYRKQFHNENRAGNLRDLAKSRGLIT